MVAYRRGRSTLRGGRTRQRSRAGLPRSRACLGRLCRTPPAGPPAVRRHRPDRRGHGRRHGADAEISCARRLVDGPPHAARGAVG